MGIHAEAHEQPSISKPSTRQIMKLKSILAILAGAAMSIAAIAGPNPNTRFFGYDWIDIDRGNVSMAAASAMINSSGPAATNLNIVRYMDSLNSAECSGGKCAFGIGLSDSPTERFDICSDATTYEECLSKNPWQNIWNFAGQISRAKNLPSAIYFLDEPSTHRALHSNGKYVPWAYASFVCTLREAMAANNINLPIFTILAMSEMPHTVGTELETELRKSIVHEINNQMPVSGCPGGYRSMPDAIGMDFYKWHSVAGVCSDSTEIYRLFSKFFPAGGNRPMWVLVPPGYLGIPALAGKNDAQIKPHVQVYWDVMAEYPNAPIAGVMVHRFDPQVMSIYSNVNMSQTRDLLRFMGNSIATSNTAQLFQNNPSLLPVCTTPIEKYDDE